MSFTYLSVIPLQYRANWFNLLYFRISQHFAKHLLIAIIYFFNLSTTRQVQWVSISFLKTSNSYVNAIFKIYFHYCRMLNVRHVMSRFLNYLYINHARRTLLVYSHLPLIMDPLSSVEHILGGVEFWPSSVLIDLFITKPCTVSVLMLQLLCIATMFLWKKPWTVLLRVLK